MIVADPPAPRPSKWVSVSGRVHRRRIRFWPGTPFERTVKQGELVMLCGRTAPHLLKQAPKGAEVTCGTCRKAANEKGHLR